MMKQQTKKQQMRHFFFREEFEVLVDETLTPTTAPKRGYHWVLDFSLHYINNSQENQAIVKNLLQTKKYQLGKAKETQPINSIGLYQMLENIKSTK